MITQQALRTLVHRGIDRATRNAQSKTASHTEHHDALRDSLGKES